MLVEGQHIPVEVTKREQGVVIVNNGTEPIRGRDGIQGEKVNDQKKQTFALVDGINGLTVSREIARRIQKLLGSDLDVLVNNLIKSHRPETQIDTVVNHAFQHVLRESEQISRVYKKKDSDVPSMVKLVECSDEDGKRYRMYYHGDNIFVLRKSGILERLPFGDSKGKITEDRLEYENIRDLSEGDRIIIVNGGVEHRLKSADILQQIKLQSGNDTLTERHLQDFADQQTDEFRHERKREMSVVVYTVKKEEDEVIEKMVLEHKRLPEHNKFDPFGNEIRRLRLAIEIATLRLQSAKSEIDRKSAKEEYDRLKRELEEVQLS